MKLGNLDSKVTPCLLSTYIHSHRGLEGLHSKIFEAVSHYILEGCVKHGSNYADFKAHLSIQFKRSSNCIYSVVTGRLAGSALLTAKPRKINESIS